MTIPAIAPFVPVYAAPTAPVPSPAAPSVQDQVSVGTSTPAPSRPQLSGLGKAADVAGSGLARLGLFGGLALGAGLGLAGALVLGMPGLALPLVGGALLGFEGADAHAAQQALQQGASSPAFQDRVKQNRSRTPLTAGSHILSVAASSAAFGIGLGVVGGGAGMIVSVAGSLALSAAILLAASKAEKAVLAAS